MRSSEFIRFYSYENNKINVSNGLFYKETKKQRQVAQTIVNFALLIKNHDPLNQPNKKAYYHLVADWLLSHLPDGSFRRYHTPYPLGIIDGRMEPHRRYPAPDEQYPMAGSF